MPGASSADPTSVPVKKTSFVAHFKGSVKPRMPAECQPQNAIIPKSPIDADFSNLIFILCKFYTFEHLKRLIKQNLKIF